MEKHRVIRITIEAFDSEPSDKFSASETNKCQIGQFAVGFEEAGKLVEFVALAIRQTVRTEWVTK